MKGALIGGVVIWVTVFVSYSLPRFFEFPSFTDVITTQGSTNSHDIRSAMLRDSVGYSSQSSALAWMKVSTYGAAVVALFYATIALLFLNMIKTGRVLVISMGLIGALTSGFAGYAFFRTGEALFGFTWLTMTIGFGLSAVIFVNLAKSSTEPTNSEQQGTKKLDKVAPPEWAKATARRIAEKE